MVILTSWNGSIVVGGKDEEMKEWSVEQDENERTENKVRDTVD